MVFFSDLSIFFVLVSTTKTKQLKRRARIASSSDDGTDATGLVTMTSQSVTDDYCVRRETKGLAAQSLMDELEEGEIV